MTAPFSLNGSRSMNRAGFAPGAAAWVCTGFRPRKTLRALIAPVTTITGTRKSGSRAKVIDWSSSKNCVVAAHTRIDSGPDMTSVRTTTVSHGRRSMSIRGSINRPHRWPHRAPISIIGAQ